MLNSIKYSHLFLRIGLAVVFLWFGINKFFDPIYWINVWTPEWLINTANLIKINSTNLIYLFGVFEILVGISLLSGVFIRILSFLGVIFLILIVLFSSIRLGFNEIILRDIGLIGALLAILFWPSRGEPYYGFN